MSAKSDDNDRRFVAPFPWVAFSLAGKAGAGARNAVLWKSAKFGIAGTGKRIAELSGAARYRAALANVGKGPVSRGGQGMAGGGSTLAKVEAAVTYTLGAAYVGAVLAANWDQMKARPAPEPAVCDNCQEILLEAPEGSAVAAEVTPCPHRGHQEPRQP